jgi:hypothetical protein
VSYPLDEIEYWTTIGVLSMRIKYLPVRASNVDSVTGLRQGNPLDALWHQLREFICLAPRRYVKNGPEPTVSGDVTEMVAILEMATAELAVVPYKQHRWLASDFNHVPTEGVCAPKRILLVAQTELSSRIRRDGRTTPKSAALVCLLYK